MRIYHSAVHGWYAIRETNGHINSGGPFCPVFEYLQRGGVWGDTTDYFDTREELLAEVEGE